MWISSQSKQTQRDADAGADLGVVTSGGWESGVYLGAERRWLPVLAPGGYRWRPQAGEQVLVLKTGADGESACILARREEQDDGLEPGEVELSSGAGTVRLRTDGSVEVTGTLVINGVPLETLIRQLAAQEG